MAESLYGFFWKQPGSLEVVPGCTGGHAADGVRAGRHPPAPPAMLHHAQLPASMRTPGPHPGAVVAGEPLHFAAGIAPGASRPRASTSSWCRPRTGDFPRWGGYEDKRDLSHIRSLIRTAGSTARSREYPRRAPAKHMCAPKYLLKNYDQFRYLLDNPYQEPKSTAGGAAEQGSGGKATRRGTSGMWLKAKAA